MELCFSELELKKAGKFYLATDFHNQQYHAEIRNQFSNKYIISYISNRCDQNSKFIDVGANIGIFSLCLAKRGTKVLAIEPLAENCLFLTHSILKNKFQNIQLAQVATGRNMGIVKMQGSSAWAQVSQNDSGIPVPLVTLDSLAELYDFMNPTCIKIDVEGSEMETLAGMKNILDSSRDLEIIFEGNVYTCGIFGYSIFDLKSFFKDYGYNLYTFLGNQIIPITYDEDPIFTVGDFLATKRDISNLPNFKQGAITLELRATALKAEMDSNVTPLQAFAVNMYEKFFLNNPKHNDLKRQYDQILLNPGPDWKSVFKSIQVGLGFNKF